jgi:hypothetical protein
MMFPRLLTTGAAAFLAVVISVTIQMSTVDSFTSSSSSIIRVHASSTQSFCDRSLLNASRQTTIKSAANDSRDTSPFPQKAMSIIAATFATVALVTLTPLDVWADGQTKDFKFPPIDYGDVNRCVLKGGSSMGQANAARDKLYDLRQCKLSGVDATGYDLSGVSK